MVEKINLNPTGIAWEQQDVVHCTNAGIVRVGNTDKFTYAGFSMDRWNEIREKSKLPLSEHPIIGGDDYWTAIYEVANVNDEYLSVRSGLCCRLNTVSAYTETVESRGTKLFRDLGSMLCYSYWTDDYDDDKNRIHPDVTAQLRIYKDRRVAVVLRIEWPDGTVRFCCANPTASQVRYGYALFHEWGKDLKREDSSVFDEILYENDGEKQRLFVVETDEDIREHSFKMAKKDKFFVTRFFVGGTDVSDLQPGEFVWASAKGMGSKAYDTFSDKTREMVNKFLGIESEENALIKKCFDKELYDRQYTHRLASKGITNVCFLEQWLSISTGAAKGQMTKQNFIDAFWPTIHWGGANEVVWERRDDLIICSYTDSYEKAVFVYDVKAKTRKLIREGGYAEAKPEMTIPSLANGIMRFFGNIECRREWDHATREYVTFTTKQNFWNDITISELVAGTNLEWIYNNLDLLPEEFVHCNEDHLVSKKEQFGKDRLGELSIAVLVTSGEALLEQLLKNKLFTLYFEALHDRGCQCERFYNVDKKRANSYYKPREACFLYSGKEKSLKKMLGMTMNQIKYVNDVTHWVEDTDSYYSSTKHKLPVLINVANVLGIENLSKLDEKTFKKIVELTMDTVETYYNRDRDIFTTFANSDAYQKITEHMTVGQKIEFMIKYKPAAGILDDYMRMRQQLIDLQVTRPGELIFDAKQYPVKPDGSTKLIRYTPGIKNPLRTWQTINTPLEFKEYVTERFVSVDEKDEEKASKKVEWVMSKEDPKELYGVLVTFSPAGHIIYLHDEISRWFQLYKDEAEMEAFKGALKRVDHLEWSDENEDGKLCIVAPRSPAEIRNEGSVLSHCVASYVDPIIRGTENIMFIRRKDMREEPFFTIDIANSGRIRQIHCYRNGNTSPADIAKAYADTKREVYNTDADVIKFVKRWCKAMKGKIDKDSIRPEYGALCAER